MTTTTDGELAFAGVEALAERVRAREVKARELVELYLRRIESLGAQLNAFRVTLADEALAAADAIDGASSAASGALAGVPIAIKDDQPVQGQALTFGSRGSDPAPQPADAEVVRRLRAAGAIPIGITRVPELMIFPWTASQAGGITRNPWDTSRTPGGSSGGSAAAVAAGLVAAATGSDGGGSIRIPAACCGLVGMKPTRGLVPMAPFDDPWLGLSTFGGLARSVGDSARLLDVIAGVERFRPAASREPGRLRIAISKKIPTGLIAKVSADQTQAWDRTARLLRELGHDVFERDPAYGLSSLEFTQTWFRGIYEDFARLRDRSQTETSTRQMAAAGRWLVPARRRRALMAKREQTAQRILSLWDEADVLLTPGLATTAIAAEGGFGRPGPVAFDKAARFTPWTPLFNLTGQPAVTLPAGLASGGLPLSVQAVGRRGEEETLYSLAAQIEAAEPWTDRRPPVS